MLKRATSIVLGLHESSTYPRGYASGSSVARGLAGWPVWASGLDGEGWLPRCIRSLRPCRTTLLGICLRQGEHIALLDGLSVQLAQKYRTV